MDFYAFNYLPGDERAALVWKQGRFLATRAVMGCSVVLYHMGGFFAEVWYSPEDNQIALVHGFESRQLLEPYLEVIDLEELMKKWHLQTTITVEGRNLKNKLCAADTPLFRRPKAPPGWPGCWRRG